MKQKGPDDKWLCVDLGYIIWFMCGWHTILKVYLNEFRRAKTTDPHEAMCGLQHVKYDVEYVSFGNSRLEMYYWS